MTSHVKSCQPLFWGLHTVFHLSAAAEAEPGQDDGWACCDPWVGSHLPCLRRVPASVSARVSLTSLWTLPRVTLNRGCASS